MYVLHFLLEMNSVYEKQNSLMFKNTDLCQNLGVKSCLCQLLVVKLSTSYITHLILSFLICKMGTSHWNVVMIVQNTKLQFLIQNPKA